MTTKKFIVRTNLKDLEDATFTCDNRADAIAYITNTLLGNSQINPQDLILEEVEVVDEEAVVMETANKVAKRLGIYCNKFDIKPFFYEGKGFAEMHFADQKYPSIGRIELEELFKVMDETSAELPEGYEVFFCINHECAIRIMLSTPKKEENK